MKLSLVIPCKNVKDLKLADLLASIEAQDFPKKEMETLIITEGTSESAKAIGIRKATGDVVAILASDNVIENRHFLRFMEVQADAYGAAYPAYYQVRAQDDTLTRYFALIGGNDPLAYYLGKNDRLPHFLEYKTFCSCGKTLGDNGFFVKRHLIARTDLENYYHIDNANECGLCPVPQNGEILHNTGGNIFSFFARRYRYGLQHAFNSNRRWHMVDFRRPTDIARFAWFIFAALTLLEPLCLSIRGYLKIKDLAWFLHPIVCLATLFTYGLLIAHLGLKRLSQLLFAPMAGRIV